MSAPTTLRLASGATKPNTTDARPAVSPLLLAGCTCSNSTAACLACRRWARTYTETQQRRRAWAKYESGAR